MMRELALAGIIVAAVASLACAQDQLTVKPTPGLWKVLTKTTRNDAAMADKTESICYSAADFDDAVGKFGTLFTNQQCERTHAIAGNTLTLGAICSGPAPQGTLQVKAEGSYVFTDEKHFTGQIVSHFALPNQPSTTFSVSKSAEYAGPCPH
ncbi:MAG TPA: DUF3617 family protein [Xanthobacteraceae bacterium]|jgi:hypothetical protein|nr:DUF3617 family protein [Xanthobacteraceae bacterium]